LEILNKGIDLKKFFISVKEAKNRILLLDYDGTLAPFMTNRDEAKPYEGVEDILDEIVQFGKSRVVLISGRWIKDLLKLIKLKRRPEIWGSHGWERLMPDNTYHIEKIHINALRALTIAEDWLREEGLYDMCELKPACVALHWRGLEQKKIDDIKKRVKKNWNLIPQKEELELVGFDGGIEIRVPGKNKGDAVEEILSESGTDFAVAYLGDDKTDEDAFKALVDKGLRILVRKEMRPTHADVWLVPPEELLDFLENWLDACRTA
jgi:trehalose-phosphatase